MFLHLSQLRIKRSDADAAPLVNVDQSNCAKVAVVAAAPADAENAERPRRSNGPLVGGKTPMSDSDARLYANTVLQTLAKRSGPDAEPLQVVAVQKATQQLVAGMLYEIKVRVTDKATDVEQDCEFSIWSRPWLTDGTQVTSKCNGLDNDKFTIADPTRTAAAAAVDNSDSTDSAAVVAAADDTQANRQ